MPVRILDGSGLGDEATIAKGIRYAASHGAQMINLSLEFLPNEVSSASDIPEIVSALNFARSRNVMVVGAAGNDQSTQIAYPARTPGVVSVGATTRDVCLADYSNNGSGLDLVAPGGGSDAIMPSDPLCHPDRSLPSIYQLTLTSTPHWARFGYPSYYIGTSMSAPEVSATAALVIASGVIGRHPSPPRLLARLEGNDATPRGRHAAQRAGRSCWDSARRSPVTRIRDRQRRQRDLAPSDPAHRLDRRAGRGAPQALRRDEARGLQPGEPRYGPPYASRVIAITIPATTNTTTSTWVQKNSLGIAVKAIVPAMAETLSPALRAISDAVLAVTSERSVDEVLQRLVDAARELVGARYAALGIPDGAGGFRRFLVAGMSDELIAAMGPLPRTHGMLGAMLESEAAYRTEDIHRDSRFRGWWPREHPDMRSFLGVPIRARDEVIGAFYLTEKPDGELFTAVDQELIELLAAHAAIAITNARLYERSRELRCSRSATGSRSSSTTRSARSCSA